MKAIVYRNTKTTLPEWDPNDLLEKKQPLGYAYETDGYFVHFYGSDSGLFTISPGITVLQKKQDGDTLENWVRCVFGAQDIQQMTTEVGEVVPAVWRPGLYFSSELRQALVYDSFDIKDEAEVLLLLLKKLADIFLYIYPEKGSLTVYSHYLRELLLLAATEYENQSKRILSKMKNVDGKSDYKHNDYLNLGNIAHIDEYQVKFLSYKDLPVFSPFKGWISDSGKRNPSWYDQYNEVKHNRIKNFKQANLGAVLNAIAANIILFTIQFGPYPLYNSQSVLSSYFNQYISISLINPDITSFYVPLLKIKPNTRNDFFVFDSYRENFNEPWKHHIIYD